MANSQKSHEDFLSDLVKAHFSSFSADYFMRYGDNEIKRHLQLISESGPQSPCKIYLEIKENQWFLLEFAGPDAVGIFTVLTGLVASHSFNIRRGLSHSYDKSAKKPYFITHFEGVYEGINKDVSALESEMQSQLDKYCKELYRGRASEALAKVRNQVGKFFSKQKNKGEFALEPLKISVSQSEKFTRLHIKGKSTKGLVFSLSNALSLRGMIINAVEINSSNEEIDDVIYVTDMFHKPITNPEKVLRLKTAVMLIKQFTQLISLAPDYNLAMEQFEKYLDKVFETDLDADKILGSEGEQILGTLAQSFGSGEFMWEEFLKMQFEELLPMLRRMNSFKQQKSKNILQSELENKISGAGFEESINIINNYKDYELFRIDLLYLIYPNKTFVQFSQELSDLADVVLNSTVHVIRNHLNFKHGTPQVDGKACRFGLFALGKLGGREIGYASDLEIVMVYEGNGTTDSADNPISNVEWFLKMMTLLRKSIHAKKQGIFELDLRLRPHGEDGTLACSVNQWESYYGPQGGALNYEKQALLKLRGIYGEEHFLSHVTEIRNNIIWGGEALSLEQMLKMRVDQIAHLVKPGTVNAKYSSGALCDIEYSVQFLQLKYGKEFPQIRLANTLSVLEQLLKCGIINPVEFEILYRSLAFCRQLINALRMVRGQAKDLEVPLESPLEIQKLVRRMGYQSAGSQKIYENFKEDLLRNLREVSGFYQEKFCGKPSEMDMSLSLPYLLNQASPSAEEIKKVLAVDGFEDCQKSYAQLKKMYRDTSDKNAFLTVWVMARRYLRMSPHPDAVLNNFERYLENKDIAQSILQQMVYNTSYIEIAVLTFGYGDFIANILINYPFFLHYVGNHSSLNQEKTYQEYKSDLEGPLAKHQDWDFTLKNLKIYHSRELLRISIRDLYHRVTLGSVVTEISNLSDVIIQSVYKLVSLEMKMDFEQDYALFALGKLGGLELNYSSDIDLVVVIKNQLDETKVQQLGKFHKLAIKTLSDFTAQGRFFRVDTKLRPYGVQGTLMSTENLFQKYFDKEAQGWELQAWIKARVISGNLEFGNTVLSRIHHSAIDKCKTEPFQNNIKNTRLLTLKRYPKKDLYWEVKQSPGGIRTAEFYVQNLQLQHARKYPELLHGHSMKALLRLKELGIVSEENFEKIMDAYVFFRRVEHGLQLEGMQQNHILPAESIKRKRLAHRMGLEESLQKAAQTQMLEFYYLHAQSLLSISSEIFPGSLDFVEIPKEAQEFLDNRAV